MQNLESIQQLNQISYGILIILATKPIIQCQIIHLRNRIATEKNPHPHKYSHLDCCLNLALHIHCSKLAGELSMIHPSSQNPQSPTRCGTEIISNLTWLPTEQHSLHFISEVDSFSTEKRKIKNSIFFPSNSVSSVWCGAALSTAKCVSTLFFFFIRIWFPENYQRCLWKC